MEKPGLEKRSKMLEQLIKAISEMEDPELEDMKKKKKSALVISIGEPEEEMEC